ncbi:MAG: glycosyltransferase family 4 protein [Gemmataceae bacterium]
MTSRLPLPSPVRAARRLAGRVRRRLRDTLRGETADTFFDLRNPAELHPVLTAQAVEPPAPDPRQADVGPTGAVRFILGLLTTRPDLARRFPDALTAGPDGAFARWLTRDSGLSPAGAANVRTAFASDPGGRVRVLYPVRHDLPRAIPFGLTPFGRRDLLAWALAHGRRDLGLTSDEVLWHLLELDETPDRGLVPTYLVRPDWQAEHPDALAGGWDRFKRFLAERYGASGRWLAQARLPTPGSRLPTPGVNVLAHFRYPSGLQEAADAVVTGAEAAGLATSLRDLPVTFDCHWQDRRDLLGVERFPVSVAVTAVNTYLGERLPEAGLYPRPGVYRVAYWYWELSDLPADIAARVSLVDEVWAPTRFVADAFRERLAVPVRVMTPGVSLPPFRRRPRADFGLPEGRFLVLFTFDMASTLARKNPLGLIAAFRRAFRRDEPADLVIKVSRGEKWPADFARLATACRDNGVSLIDRVMPRDDVLALLDGCDCYASLHRSEGLGLGMAEAMLLGKPVIATNYSGNTDFMTPDTAYLVDYREVTIPADVPPYPQGFVWAEPSVEHAATLLRRVYERREEAAERGRRAKRHVEAVLDPGAAGRRMADRIREIYRERGLGG